MSTVLSQQMYNSIIRTNRKTKLNYPCCAYIHYTKIKEMKECTRTNKHTMKAFSGQLNYIFHKMVFFHAIITIFNLKSVF